MHEHLVTIHGEEPPVRQLEGCTEPQWSYLTDLAAKVNYELAPRGTFTKQSASAMIERLKSMPQGGGGTFSVVYEAVENDDGTTGRTGFVVLPAGDRVPAGRYAIPTPQAKNEHSFYRLWIGDRGGWALYQQVSDDRLNLERTVQLKVLAQIARDPAGASQLFGQLIGQCGVCGRTLTNDESRARGIGPICAARF